MQKANIFYIIARKLHQRTKDFLEIPVERERAFLKSLPEPKDDYQRSYLQYCCQNFYKKTYVVLFLNIVAWLIQPFALLFLLAKGVFVNQQSVSFDAVSDLEDFKEVIPQEVKGRYTLDFAHWFSACSLSRKDLFVVWHLWKKYPFSGFFNLKCMLKLSYYSHMIRAYRPKAIVTHNEFAFTSSISTHFCEHWGVKHINVMHGEKLFYIRDSFFRFTQMYIWNEYYRDLFLSLRAASSQFVVSVPQSLHIEEGKYQSEEVYADFKYYLQIYTADQIASIVSSMEKLKRKGYSVKYRPHPRYSNIALLENVVSKSEIEYPREVSILSSVDNSKYAVGSFTTVLNQAAASGKTVVLDDVTYVQQYLSLEQRGYIFSACSLSSHKLSSLINL